MKTKLIQFYREKIQPRIEALKAKVVQLKQRAGGWLARSRRTLGLAVIVTAILVTLVMLIYLWQGSPAFRAAVKGLAAAVAGSLAGLWALIRGHRPAEIPVPVVVTEQPRPAGDEEAIGVMYSAEDGRF